MPAEPQHKRAIVFVDGQNLYYAAKLHMKSWVRVETKKVRVHMKRVRQFVNIFNMSAATFYPRCYSNAQRELGIANLQRTPANGFSSFAETVMRSFLGAT